MYVQKHFIQKLQMDFFNLKNTFLHIKSTIVSFLVTYFNSIWFKKKSFGIGGEP